jgi:outer membrane protein assembly factor BamB
VSNRSCRGNIPSFLSFFSPINPALTTALTVSNDSGLIYVTDSSFNLVCIDATTGGVRWSDDGNRRSGYMAEPKLSEIEGQNSMVYIIETDHGNVRQHDASDGSINWASDCIDRTSTNKCQDSVEAEFRYVGCRESCRITLSCH